MKLRVILVVLIGAVSGLLSMLATHLIFKLTAIAAWRENWHYFLAGAAGGILVLFIATQMMAQSNPRFRKGTVIGVIGGAVFILGIILLSGFLLVVRFTNYEFFQGQGFLQSVFAALAAGAVSLVSFLIAAPIRGFEHERTGDAGERFEIRIKSKMLNQLRRGR